MGKNHNEIFCWGALYGAVFVFIIGVIANRIRESRGRMGVMNQTLNTFSDAVQPRLTSRGIFFNSVGGFFSCIFWIFFLVIVIYFIYRITPTIISLFK